MKPVYIDSDGVVADWVTHMIDVINHPEIVCQETLNKHPERTELIKTAYVENPHIFNELPPIANGIKLVSLLRARGIPFKMLTAVGEEHFSFDIVKETKLQWLTHHLSLKEEDIICVHRSSDKVLYVEEGVFLIDDYEKNVSQWSACGGVGVLFKDDPETLNDIVTTVAKAYRQ